MNIDPLSLVTKAILGVIEQNWVVAALIGVAITAVILWRGLAYTQKRQERHRYNRKRSWTDLKTIREISPKEKPGKVFAWLRKVDPYRFEEMVLSELERRGQKIIRNESYSGDGGIDGQFYAKEQLYLVQAKRYQGSIKKAHIWAFEAICQQRGAMGIFIHTGKTPNELREFKRQCGVCRIISGEELMKFFAGEALALTRRPKETRRIPASAALETEERGAAPYA